MFSGITISAQIDQLIVQNHVKGILSCLCEEMVNYSDVLEMFRGVCNERTDKNVNDLNCRYHILHLVLWQTC